MCKEYGPSCHLRLFHCNGTRLEKIALKSSDINGGLRGGGDVLWNSSDNSSVACRIKKGTT